MSCTTVLEGATLDANILVYGVDVRDPAKHAIARRITRECARSNCRIPLQSLNEFYRATTKKSLQLPAEGERVVRLCRRSMQIVSASEADLIEAIHTYDFLGLQFFDALLIATALRAGCTTMFSEDMQHGRDYNGLRVVNPFLLTPAELDEMIEGAAG